MTEQQQQQEIEKLFSSVENRHDIFHVLAAFEMMGASLPELERELLRLCADAKYCRDWAVTIGFYDNMRRY